MTQIFINHSADDAVFEKYPQAYRLANQIGDMLRDAVAPVEFINVFTPVTEAYLAANNLYRFEINVKGCAGAVYASGHALEQADIAWLAQEMSRMVTREIKALIRT